MRRLPFAALVRAGTVAVFLCAGMITWVSAEEADIPQAQRTVPADSAFDAAGLWAALDTLAARNGVRREDFRVDPAALELAGGYPGRVPLQRYLMSAPLRAPAMLEALGRSFMESATTCPSHEVPEDAPMSMGADTALRHLAELAGMEGVRERAQGGVQGTHTGMDTTAATQRLTTAMETLYRGTGKRFQGKARERIRRDCESLDPVIVHTVADLVTAVARAAETRGTWLADAGIEQGGIFGAQSKRTAEALRQYLRDGWSARAKESATARLIREASTEINMSDLAAGAIRLSADIEHAGRWVSHARSREFQFDWSTPRGWISVGGTGRNTYSGPRLLVVDMGGDDIYRGPGSVSGEDGVSVVVDYAGDDRYAPADSNLAGPGGAILGYAAVVDRGAGRDEYAADTWACGFGFLGVGWIEDDGGDDRYAMTAWGEGAAIGGLGLLLDRGGDDRYELVGDASARQVGFGQGCAGERGAALLLDLAGSDAYSCRDLMSREALVNKGLLGAARGAQGAAFGGHDAGGSGFLLDIAGDDTYSAGGYSQGAGVGAGLGALIDLQGADEYSARRFGQGCGVEQGVGILVEGGGNDVYRVDQSLGFAMGHGSDLGLGMLADASGDDRYHAGDSCMGASVSQGAGIFLDCAGEDSYTFSYSADMGVADDRTSRVLVPGVALFVDLENDARAFPTLGGRIRAARESGPSCFRGGASRGGSFLGGVAVLPVYVPYPTEKLLR